jgi:starch synthase
MRIVFLSSEMSPLAKVGGLADVVGSLPRALQRRGHEVSVILPAYGPVLQGQARIEPVTLEVEASLRGEAVRGTVLRTAVDGVPVYLLDQFRLFRRNGIYGEGGRDYPDNAERFGWFSAAALEALSGLDLRPQILHLHDWQTALAAVWLEVHAAGDPGRQRPATLCTIHNLAYQGRVDAGILPVLGLPSSLFHPEGLEFYGQVNLLKGGIVYADLVSTVSPTYAREIQTPSFGQGLDGVLATRSHDLFGVLNGLDPDVWDPSRDAALAAPYSADDPAGKRACKRHLQRSLALEVGAGIPLCGAVGRLDPQKGFDLLAEAAPVLLERGMQLVVLGAGHSPILDELRLLARQHPDRASITERFDEDLARRIYAGADLFLMPSRYEPCGLAQMIAMRYGALPVVHRTGGLADSVVDLLEEPDGGNGFVFDCDRTTALIQAVLRAVDAWRSPRRRRDLVARAMKCRNGWDAPAHRYEEIYARAVDLRESGRGAVGPGPSSALR